VDTLIVTVHSVKLPVGFGKQAMKNMGTPLPVMAHPKKSIVEVKAEENCLAHALLITIGKVDNNANYKPYRQVRKIRSVVQTLLQETGINLPNDPGIPQLVRLKEHCRHYKITVYQSLSCKDVIYYTMTSKDIV